MALPDLSRLPALGSNPATSDFLAGVVASSQQNGRWSLSQIAAVTGGSFSIINVKNYGALGDGSTNDTTAIQNALNAAFGSSASPHGQSTNLNLPVYFPPGVYIVSGNPALRVTGVRGGLIFGAGMASSIIRGTTNGGVTFLLNGFGFSTMRDLTIDCSGSGATVALDYDFDNVAPQGSQSSLFQNCAFYGLPGAKNASAIACRLGNSGFQTDTSTFLSCVFANANYGLASLVSANCIQHTVLGGQFQSNNYGVRVTVGGIETVHGAFFLGSATYDISVTGGALNGYSICGCRSESVNFLQAVPSASCVFHVEGADHAAIELGTFLSANAVVHVDGCWSALGKIEIGAGGSSIGNITIDDSIFNRFDALAMGGSSIATTTFIKNSYFGDIRSGLGRYVTRQKIVRNVVRTLDVEATALSDLQVLYDNYNGLVTQNNIINTSPSGGGLSPSFTVASPTLVNMAQPVSYQGGEPVAFSLVSAGSLPTGITSGRTYFVAFGTSTTSNDIPTVITGTKTWTTNFALGLTAGTAVVAYDTADTTKRISGTVSTNTGTSLVLTVTGFSGAGTGITTWTFKVQNSMHLSDTQANALAGTANVNVSGAGSGSINSWAVRRWAVGDVVLKSNVAAAGSTGWICTTAGWGSTVNAGETQAVFGTLPVIT